MFNFFKRILRTSNRNVPDFIIIGAQKSGTTALYEMLAGLKGFFGSKDKEPGFFSHDKFYNSGTEWYKDQFDGAKNKDLRYEATPAYFYYDFVPKRIYECNPDTKFILTLRDPTSRCYSAWNMYRTFNEKSAKEIYQQFVKHANPDLHDAVKYLLFARDYPSFKNAVQEDLERWESASTVLEPSFVRRGIYSQQLKNYLKYFDISNFLILEQSELKNSIELFARVEEFLKVPINHSVVQTHKSNVGEYELPTEEELETLKMLRQFYRPYNDEFFQLIGKRFNWNDSQ